MKIPSGWINAASVTIIAILTTDVVLLTLKVRRLESYIQNTSVISNLDPLKPGDHVQSFSALSLDGRQQTIAYSDTQSTYLLFVLSTTCPHCEENISIWKTIVENIGGECFFVGVSLHDLPRTIAYIVEKAVPFYTVSVADTGFQRQYKISGVPATILIDGGGRVANTWIGKLDAMQVDDIVSQTRQSLDRTTN